MMGFEKQWIGGVVAGFIYFVPVAGNWIEFYVSANIFINCIVCAHDLYSARSALSLSFQYSLSIQLFVCFLVFFFFTLT